MKKALGLVLSAILMASVSSCALGAIHDSWGDFTTHSTGIDLDIASYGNWYYIEKESPYLIGNFKTNSDRTDGAGIYYLDDFTFGEIGTIAKNDGGNDKSDSKTVVRGSYKFENGIFAGLDASSLKSDYSTLSGGYVFPLDKNGWVAASLDYGFSEDNDALLGLEVGFRYYDQKMRVFGQIYAGENESKTAGDTYLDLGVNYQMQKDLVVGGAINVADETDLTLGATYKIDRWVLDGEYSTEDDGILDLMGMCQVTTEFTAGAECLVDDDDNTDKITLKGKYALDKESQLMMSLGFGGNDEIQVAYYKSL